MRALFASSSLAYLTFLIIKEFGSLAVKIILILLSVFSTIGICIGGYFLIFRLEVPIQYNEKLIGVQAIEDRMMEFEFLEDDFYRCHYLQRTVEIDGQIKNILMLL